MAHELYGKYKKNSIHIENDNNSMLIYEYNFYTPKPSFTKYYILNKFFWIEKRKVFTLKIPIKIPKFVLFHTLLSFSNCVQKK